MSFRMTFNPLSGRFTFTLGCRCGARQHWFNEPCYVAWRSKVARTGWKADWPERCPACGPGAVRKPTPELERGPRQGVLPYG